MRRNQVSTRINGKPFDKLRTLRAVRSEPFDRLRTLRAVRGKRTTENR